MITFACIPLGVGTACACTGCAPAAERSFLSAEVVAARVADSVEAWSDGPGPNVMFTGPEPFSHPELPAIVAAAQRAGIERIGLRTDAGALSLPGNAEGVIAAGVRHLQVVVLGGDAQAHDALSGRSGLYDAAMAGIRAFVDTAGAAGEYVAVTGFVPVCAHNLVQLPAVVGAFARAGAVSVDVSVTPSANGALGASDWLDAAIDTGMVNGVWVSVSGLPAGEVPRSPLHALAPSVLSGESS